MVKFCSSCGKRLSFFEGLPPGSCICTDCKKKNITEERRIEPEKGVEKERKKIAEVIEEIKFTQVNEQIIGIDLGTSYSQAAVLQGGKFTIIPSAEGRTVAGKMCPSVIAFTKNGQVLVGEPARRQAITNPEGTVASVKRKFGTNHKYKIHDKEYAPQQISAFILQKIKRDAEAFLGKEVKKAVITVPSSFNDNQRTATKDSGRIAGFEVVRLLNESTAAAMAYSLFDCSSQKIMVFDLGGGKLDVTLMDIGGGVFTVLTTSGDTQIGGNDIDAVIVNWIIKEFKKREGIDLSTDRMVTERVHEAAEKAKIELSTILETEINLPYISADRRGQKHLSQKLTRGQLEQLVDPIIKRCIPPIEQALKDAHLSKQDISKVILVGGPTRMPIVEESIKRYMGISKVECRGDPMEYVAIGAAIQGSILAGAITNRVLLDVYSHTLGIETLGKVMTPLIERNTTIPTKRSQIFSTTWDSQTTVTIHVLQGDRTMAKDNISLGKFNLVEILPAPRGKPQIEVTFDIDASGIIKVSAKDLGTGREQKMTVTASTKLSEGEIERMVNEAKKLEEENRKKIEEVRIQNLVLSYTAEKLLTDHGESLSAAQKSSIEAVAKCANEASKGKVKEVICDVCNRKIEENQGFLLTTKEVVTSEKYWLLYLRLLMARDKIPLIWLGKNILIVVAGMARSDPPWMICDTCSELFSFDRNDGKERARFWQTTGQPEGGFALCRLNKTGTDIIVENIDDKSMVAATNAALKAITMLKGEPHTE